MLLRALQQPELCPRAHKIVLLIARLVVCVAVDIVGEEPHTLHIGEQRGGVRQAGCLHRKQERARLSDVSPRKSAEDVHVEADVSGVGVVLESCVRRRAEEVAVV